MSRNPLLDDIEEIGVFNGVTIQLPTGGRFYHEGILDEGIDVDNFPVGMIGIAAELSLKDPILNLSGDAIPTLIQMACPGVNEPEELADIDVEAILIGTRIASYGSELKFKHVCQNDAVNPDQTKLCEVENDVEIDLIAHAQRFGRIEDWDRFVLELPEIKQTVFLRPMPYRASLEMIRLQYQNQRQSEQFNNASVDDFVMDRSLVEKYRDMISANTKVGIDIILSSIMYVRTSKGQDVVDRDIIREWMLKLPTRISELVATRITEITEDTANKSKIEYLCQKCGFKNELQLQLDLNKLFTPASSDSARSEEDRTPLPPSAKPKKKRPPVHSRTLSR